MTTKGFNWLMVFEGDCTLYTHAYKHSGFIKVEKSMDLATTIFSRKILDHGGDWLIVCVVYRGLAETIS
jgi:hypothetical protein